MADVKAREEELRGIISEDDSTRDQIKKAFAAIGGMGGGGGGGNGAAGGGPEAAEEETGFAKPQLAAGAAAPVNLGVVVGPARYCSPRHRMAFSSRNGGPNACR